MKRKTKDIYNAIFALAFSGLAIWGSIVSIKKGWEIFSALDPAIAAAILAASATIIVPVLSVLVSKNLEHRRELLKESREKVTPMYEELIEFIFTLMIAIRDKTEQPTEREMKEFMDRFTQKIIVSGSDQVLSAFYKYRQISIKEYQRSDKQGGNNNYNVLFCIEDLLLAIRKDLGHKNAELKRGKILGLFVNDIESFIPAKK